MSDKDISEMSREEFIAFLIEERESSLDIGSSPRRVRYSKPEERREPTPSETLHDARFEIIGVGDMPEGEFFWCSFCGNRAKHFILVKRLTDNTTWKVGKICIGRVGLTLPKSVKRVVIKRDTKKYKRVEEQKAEKDEKPKEREETHPGMKKFLEEQKKKEDEEFVREINESVKVEEKPKKPEKKEGQPKVEEDEDGYNLDDIFED